MANTDSTPANTINPEIHATYWQENHASQPYAKDGGDYEQYRTAYHTGYTGAQEHAATKTFADAESTLKSTYEQAKDSVGLGWDKAKHATKAAYDKAAEEIQIILHEEQLRVGKREVSAGEVQLRKTVRTEQVNVPVEFKEETIDVPLTREEAVVSKEAHVTGAVRVKKTAQTETQQVSEQVRKEDVEVVRDGQTEAGREDRAKR